MSRLLCLTELLRRLASPTARGPWRDGQDQHGVQRRLTQLTGISVQPGTGTAGNRDSREPGLGQAQSYRTTLASVTITVPRACAWSRQIVYRPAASVG